MIDCFYLELSAIYRTHITCQARSWRWSPQAHQAGHIYYVFIDGSRFIILQLQSSLIISSGWNWWQTSFSPRAERFRLCDANPNTVRPAKAVRCSRQDLSNNFISVRGVVKSSTQNPFGRRVPLALRLQRRGRKKATPVVIIISFVVSSIFNQCLPY
jgi:hypothetical protein